MSRQDLFPPIEPYATGMLRLDALHTMYWEQSGNPRGLPVRVPAWRPGRRRDADASPLLRPATPIASSSSISAAPGARRRWARSTTTPPAIWSPISSGCASISASSAGLVFGGSWGSTLALAYARGASASAAAACVLRGIFLCRRAEIDWFLYGMRSVFPEAWRAFAGFLPEAERGDLLGAYYRRLTDPDPAVHMPAARAWSTSMKAPARRCCRAPTRWRPSARTAWRWAWRASRRIISAQRSFLPDGRSARRHVDRIRRIPGRRSCRAATTWSARSSAPTSWPAPGPRPNMSSCPMPAIRRWSRASARRWSPRLRSSA